MQSVLVTKAVVFLAFVLLDLTKIKFCVLLRKQHAWNMVAAVGLKPNFDLAVNSCAW